MKIIDVTLRNFRKHRLLRVAFGNGVNAIVGKNAKGKTSILEAIVFGLTGSLFHGTKESAITVGQDSGVVELNFELNNKLGRIVRHLEATKITLTYDGVTYKKATEVKEMWDKLLQVQPEFIENIITARQGKIDALFSDDDEAAKEKLFQKIFLVPPTEKIRSALYRNYMKQAPPLLPVEDPAQLYTIKTNKVNEIAEMQKKFEARQLCYSRELDLEFQAKKAHLEKCIKAGRETDLLRQRKDNNEVNLVKTTARIDELRTLLSSISIDEFKNEIVILNTALEEGRKKRRLLQELEKVTSVNKEDSKVQFALRDAKMEEASTYLAEISKIEAKATLLAEICHAEHIEGHACPTCKQDISQLHELKASSSKELEKIEEETYKLYDLRNKAQKECTAALERGWALEKAFTEKERVLKELEKYPAPALSYEQEVEQVREITKLETVVANYTDYDKELRELLVRSNTLAKTLATLQTQLQDVAVYDGERTPEEDLEEANEVLLKLADLREEEVSYSVKLQVAQARVIELDERIAAAERDSERNAKRNRYMEVVTRIYDGFHVSNFPRKLVQSYTNAVTERLQEKLDSFGIPFTARINEKFETLIYDTEGRRLPTASGGQKVLLGLSLHLALHDLFSQSFPLFMIDEGTTHLDGENVDKYFEFISSLKADKKLNQIIIIDHHEGLKEVVDHVIEL